MKIVFSFLFVNFVMTQDDINWNKVFPNYLPTPTKLPSRDADEMYLRIVGGEEADPHSRPYQVGLLLPVPRGKAFCGGSLISKRTILTAAHCVDRLTGPAQIILGAHNIRERDEESQIRIRSSEVIIHPDWNRRRLRNDIALVILPYEIELDDNIQTIELPSKSSSFDYTELNATVTGWGRSSDAFKGVSPVLREVTLPIISNFWCSVAYAGSIVDGHICASGTGGKSTCNGDSGGPLVVKGVQIGIVSFGIIFGCEIGWPAVFTRITHYNDWIQQNMVDE